MSHSKVPFILLVSLIPLIVWSAISPFDYQVWWTEICTAIVPMLVLGVMYPKFKFSNTSYLFFWIWCIIQIIGAHYTFELVPFGAVTDFFGFSRNHYDRMAHFVVGFSAYGIAEYIWRRSLVNSVGTATVFSIIFILALAGFWELVEWIYAEIDGGDAGQAFLGSQGDVWDAHKDMLMDTMGAILAGIFFYIRHKVSNPIQEA